MTMTTKAIGRCWLAIIATSILAIMMAAAWKAEHLIRQYHAIELTRTTAVASRAIAYDIQHAFKYDIPLDKLAGVEAWLASIIDLNPVIMAIAVTDIHGNFLYSHDVSPALKNALHKQQRAAQITQIEGFHVETTALQRSPNTHTDGWLHVASQSVDIEYRIYLALALCAVVIIFFAALSLRHLLRRRLINPIAHCRDALEQIRDGKIPLLPSHAARHPAALLQAALCARMRQLEHRKQQVHTRLMEVRAAHFAPAVLAEIDRLVSACTRLLPAAMPASSAKHASTRHLRLNSRFITRGMVSALIVVACAMYVLTRTLDASENRNLIALHTQALEHAWEAITTKNRSRLEQVIAATKNQILATPAGAQSGDAQWEKMLQSNAASTVTLTLARQDGSVVASSAGRTKSIGPGSSLLELLRLSQASFSGIWQNSEFEYEIGAAQRLSVKGQPHPLVLIATQPLTSSISDLQQRTNTRVALADLRGQPVFETDAPIVDQWHSHKKAIFAGFINNPKSVFGEIPLLDAADYKIGKLISLQTLTSEYTPLEKILGVLAFLAGLAAALLALACLADFLKRIGHSAGELASLATAELPAREGTLLVLSPEQLKQTAALLALKVSELEQIRRSRNRQGQRQARFIRHHMIGLAAQLPHQERADIMHDLVEVQAQENAAQNHGQPLRNEADLLNPAVEAPVDEMGIIAHSFQNLAKRLGDKYQELDRLVIELRDALRSKTELMTLRGELDAARQLQSSILPKDFKISAHLELQATVVPAQEVGGDFYDFFRIDEHRVAIIVADVSGKGISGALFMAICCTLLRAVAQVLHSPGQCLERINNVLSKDNDQTMFVTLFYAVIDARDGAMTYANAGHNPPYVIRSRGPVEPIAPTGGIPLAVMEGFAFEEHRLVLNANDRLFLYTDGVTEALDPQRALFGEKRLEQLLESARAMPIENVAQHIINEVNVFAAGAPQADDITCFMAAYQPADAGRHPALAAPRVQHP